MATSKQRQRQLARAKWERQQSRRAASARRQRIVSSVVGVVVGLVAVVGVTLLVRYILDQDSTGQPAPSAPTNLPPSAIPTSILPTTPGTPSVPPTPAPSQQQSGPQSQQQSPARTDRSGDESR